MATEEPQQNGASESSANAESPRDVKNVYIYRNGDPFYRPHRFTVNNKQHRNYDSFLTQVTTTIKPRFGCVRKLHTPDHGRRVADIEALEPGKFYVAAGQEAFVKLPYRQIPEKETVSHAPPKPKQEITPVYHSRIQVSAKLRKTRPEPVTIFVYENGNDLKGPSRVLLTPREQASWEQVLQAVSDKVTLAAKGAVRVLYTLKGECVTEVSQLRNSESYVAVAGDKKFTRLDYEKVRRPINISPKLDRKRYERLEFDGLKNKQGGNTRKGGRGGAARGTKKSTGGSSSRNSGNTDDDVYRNGSNRGAEQNGRGRQNSYDDKDDGPYRSRQESGETRGAREVEDGDDTKVDLPIDQQDAEEVQDDETERYNGNYRNDEETKTESNDNRPSTSQGQTNDGGQTDQKKDGRDSKNSVNKDDSAKTDVDDDQKKEDSGRDNKESSGVETQTQNEEEQN